MNSHKVHILAELIEIVAERKQTAASTSYTAKLLSGGVERCAKKFGEEAIEIVLAAMAAEKTHIRSEAADVFYHLVVLLEACGVRFEDVMDELAVRMNQSGLDEKSSRKRP